MGPSWVLGRLLARGGMSAVYVGRHAITQRDVAVKILDPAVFADPAARERFIREVTAPVRIGHPGIVEILDAGTDAGLGVHYVVMELLTGHDLRQELSSGPVAVDRALALARGMLEPLAAAHRAGVVHRDLKPENLFLCSDGLDHSRMKILDFGIARDLTAASATATATAIGTPYYMSPEQMHSARSVGPQADVWSVGVILHEMLSGAPPFDGETAPAIFVAIATKEPPPLPSSIPTGVRTIVTSCLQKSPSARPQDAEVLLELLDASSVQPLIAPTVPLPRGADVGSPRFPPPGSRLPRTLRMPPASRTPGTSSEGPALPGSTRVSLGILGATLLVALGMAAASVSTPRRSSPPRPPPSAAPASSDTLSHLERSDPSGANRGSSSLPAPNPTTAPDPPDQTASGETDQAPAPDVSPEQPARGTSHPTKSSPRPAPLLHQLGEACRVDGDCEGDLVCARDRHCARSLSDLLGAAPSPPATTPEADTAAAAIAAIDLRAAPTEATPTREETLRAMQSVQSAVEHCAEDEHGTAVVRVSVSGSTGHVTNASVTGVFAGTPVGSCVASSVRQAVFPRFRNPTFTLEYSYRL